MSSDKADADGTALQHRLSEKELFLVLLVGITILMSITGFVLIIN